MEELFGLPAHPLLVHFPVVAIPTLTVLGLIVALWPSFRERFGLAVWLLGVVTFIGTVLAASSGTALAEGRGYEPTFYATHESLGETLRLFVLGLVVSLGALQLVTRNNKFSKTHPATIVTTVVVLAFTVLSAIWTIRTGHEGAKLTWQ